MNLLILTAAFWGGQRMRVMVIGGTGFIGYHIVQALRKQGAEVCVLCRHPEAAEALFIKDVQAICGDIAGLLTENYVELLRGFDGVVFAAGADERCAVEGDADAFFHKANVWPCEQLFAALPQTTVKHAVLLSSIFLWVDQQKPALSLTLHHPYIRSRAEQNRVAQAAVQGTSCVLTTLLVPWIFGSSPHRPTQWETLVNYVRAAVPLLCIQGGANMMSVQALAQAVCGALQYPQQSSVLPVGDRNLHYAELMQHLCEHAGRNEQQVKLVSDGFFRDMTALGSFFSNVFGAQAGIDLAYMADLLLQDIHFDPAPSQQLLHYSGGDLEHAWQDTVTAAPESKLLGGWRNCLNWFSRA